MVCLILSWWNISGQVVLETRFVIPKVTELRQKLIEVAESQVGIKESSGKNDGISILKFQKSVGIGAYAAWCAAFVGWCHAEIKIPYPVTGVAANWFNTNVVYKKGANRVNEFIPKKGQVAGEGYGSRITHISIIVKKWDSYHYLTIGGNETNSVRKRVKETKYILRVADHVGHEEYIVKDLQNEYNKNIH